MKEEARERIKETIDGSEFTIINPTTAGKLADRILALEGEDWRIVVVEKEGELPERTHICIRNSLFDNYTGIGYKVAQQDMLKEGWIKEVENE